MGLAYLVASAHPDNVASNRSLKKLGMEHKQTLVRGEKFLRNAYCLLL
jgi:RimJ/RimL family protein N-acetyltransferase